jgi:thiosulfate/3-mercaptopyruvate sulfurtransferase
MSADKIVELDSLLSLTQHNDQFLLDVRPLAAYNGWTLEGEPRGGHIKSAKTFPLSWTGFSGWQKLLDKKGIDPEKRIIVYGYNAAQSAEMADKLAQSGYRDVRRFDQFMHWSADSSLPMDHLPRFKQLVYPGWVQGLITGENPPHYDNSRYVICHASFRYREDYESGHIPGAIHMDTEDLESSKDWNRRSPADIRRALLKQGITKDTTVVLYGRFNHPNNEDEYPGRLAGHLAAMRCAQIMLYAGVEDVRILNGGMAAWREEGFDMITEEGEVVSADNFGTEIPHNPNLIIDTPEAKQLLSSKRGELVSIRSWKEFIGDVSGYNYIEKVGRIPGAVFGNCGSDAYHMENYRNIDHTMREYHEVAEIWADSGITPNKRIAFYCGTGWRASEAYFNAYMMGWPDIAVYDGGWMEWSSDPENPVEAGLPEGQVPAWQS